MKEWCLQHPWMTFFAFIFTIWIISKNINTILGGKRKFVENLKKEGVIEMSKIPNGKGNGNSNGREIESHSGRENTSCPSHNERGSQTVPPSATSAPTRPPRQN